MKEFFKNYGKYGQAQLWLERARARQAIKQGSGGIVTAQGGNDGRSVYVANKPQLVFSQMDLGHNPEETKKIQALYAELGDSPLLPLFATA